MINQLQTGSSTSDQRNTTSHNTPIAMSGKSFLCWSSIALTSGLDLKACSWRKWDTVDPRAESSRATGPRTTHLVLEGLARTNDREALNGALEAHDGGSNDWKYAHRLPISACVCREMRDSVAERFYVASAGFELPYRRPNRSARHPNP